MNLVQSSQILSISLFLEEFFHRHSNKLLSSLFSKKNPPLSTDDLPNFCLISNPNVIFKILEKVVASHIQSHLFSNSLSSFLSAYRLTGYFILLELIFLTFTMTSSLQLIMVRLHHSFFSTYLLHLILSIIPSFSLVFEIGSVLVILLNCSHLISPLALRQSQSMIPSLHSLLSPLVYPKVPYLVYSFSPSIQLLLAR